MEKPERKKFGKVQKISLWIIGISVAVIIIASALGEDSSPGTQESSSQESTADTAQNNTSPELSKEEAQAQLEALMEVSKAAKIVTSYEFSETAVNVYVDKAWYEQPVTFKKDFLARVGNLKEITTGYKHFEVRDAYSNEKVAEIKSFSGSLEVYK